MRAANLALKFLLELAAFAALAYWGSTVNIAVAVLAPAAAIVLWALFAAPRSSRRLPTAARVPFELAVFGASAVALFAADQVTAAIVFAVLAIVNAVLLAVFDQLEA